ncbi:hypothetical protein COV18_04190 [Candidatus Woesearchaeota archaeon CG10_big_fil_rev_8_21_14_0_10_37_12]|nr:MAG: hypothetical protein COV18_04190 [Candidatus Woesearchaeota archaeon CG10_big_fil_rev_8_21_14_0_10_37_12]
MTKIDWDPKTKEFLQKIEKEIARRIFRKVDVEIRANVIHYLEPLVGRSDKKIRIGDYRLFVTYESKTDNLIIHAIRHRRDAYNN